MSTPESTTPPTKHLSIGPNGETAIDLHFIEEPLGIPWTDGYGWPFLDFGEHIGPNGRFSVCRKLGFGSTSSTWIALDQRDKRYVAIKALNGAATERVLTSESWEKDAHEALLNPSHFAAHCLLPQSKFIIDGRGSAGRHLCYVTELYGGNVEQILKGKLDISHGYPKVVLRPVAKHILLHVLRGIAHAHKCGVIHTDIKPDNILFSNNLLPPEIEHIIASDPSRRHPPESSVDGDVKAAVSQPLPIPTSDEAYLSRQFVLADFGSARPLKSYRGITITSPTYRAPEVILAQTWNEKVDIWAFGCLVFELTMGLPLFSYASYTPFNLDAWENVLYQMLVYLGDDFKLSRLDKTEEYAKYFDNKGLLHKDPPDMIYSIESMMGSFVAVTKEEAAELGRLIRRCLVTPPEERASAEELLSDPWFYGVD